MKPKSVVTILLLVFVGASIVILVVKNLANTAAAGGESAITDGVVVYYFHGTERCATCQNMEANTREAIQTRFADRLKDESIALVEIDYQAPGNEHYVRDFELPAPAPAVVLECRKGGRQQAWKKLDRAFELAGTSDKKTFVEYVQQETTAFLEGSTSQAGDEQPGADGTLMIEEGV
ncbi:MAG: hypothetical protein A2V70_08650 [Planctomycetes bacterium RBG_13_63_9]|nr:MAG: hypothetical protein A2V70_08650 [Planctomycetes bacterium RBG_13_63_9]